MTNVESRLLKVVDELFDLTPEQLSGMNRTESLAFQFLLDSLDMVEFTMAVEEEFGLEISDSDIEDYFTTFESVLNYVTRHLAERNEK